MEIKEIVREFRRYSKDHPLRTIVDQYFDEQGNLLRVEDKDGKDRDYPMTYREAFRRVCWRYGFSLKDVDILIIPTDEGVFCFFDKGENKQMIVNMKTGKVKKIQMEYKE